MKILFIDKLSGFKNPSIVSLPSFDSIIPNKCEVRQLAKRNPNSEYTKTININKTEDNYTCIPFSSKNLCRKENSQLSSLIKIPHVNM